MPTKLPGLSVIFPAFNDEKSLPLLIKKTLKIVPGLAKEFEIIIVNDGSEDNTGQVIEKLSGHFLLIKVITHPKNLGYGAAITDGFRHAKYPYIFYTDSDGQYDVGELINLREAMNGDVDMVTGYKINRSDSLIRKFVGLLYNQSAKRFFHLKVKDVDCDFRLFKKKILKGLKFKTKSGGFDVEFIYELQKKGIKIQEIPVHHYPRMFGKSQFFSPRILIESLKELRKIKR